MMLSTKFRAFCAHDKERFLLIQGRAQVKLFFVQMVIRLTVWLTLDVDIVPVCSLSYPLLQLPRAVAIDQRDEWYPQVVGDDGCYIKNITVQVARDQVAVHDQRNWKKDGLSCLEGQSHTSSLGAEQSCVHVAGEQTETSQDGEVAERQQHSSRHGAVQ